MENYFDLFEIPIQLKVDPSTIRSRFFALSRQFHPDFFVNRSAAEQHESLERTAQLNKAWKIFQQPDELIRYVLELHGSWTAGEKYELSPDFLMEVMEINESMMDMEEGGKEGLQNQVSNLQANLFNSVASYFSETPFAPTPEKLAELKEYYYRKKYLDRIVQGLS
jgi:molecular chaperone HscB